MGSNPTVLTALMVLKNMCLNLRRKYAPKKVTSDRYVIYDVSDLFRSSSTVERLTVNQQIEVRVLPPELRCEIRKGKPIGDGNGPENRRAAMP